MYEAITRNKWRSVLLVFGVSALLLVLGYVLGAVVIGKSGGAIGGVGIAGLIAIVMGLLSYYQSDRIILWVSGARPVDREEHTELYYAVESLALAAGIPAPRVYVIDNPSPNAFATGRNPRKGVVCVTTGLLEKLDRLELEGVIAHELAHIRNYDMLFMSMVVVMIGAIALISDVGLRYMFWGGRGRDREGGGSNPALMLVGLALAILAPIFASMLQLAISRRREFLADATAALITRYPEGLAAALEKIGVDRSQAPLGNRATAHLYIANPLREGGMSRLFSTHPPIEERVAALRRM